MKLRRVLMLVSIIVSIGAFCLSISALAEDANQPNAIMQPNISNATIGSGPTADASSIQSRGYVTNLCEEQVMADQLISQSGGQRVVSDYKVAYLLDPPKGWYMQQGNQLVWRAPAAGENQHIEAVVFDSLTGKTLPVTPTLDVIDSQGRVVQSKQLQYLWHPFADHYGANYTIPCVGTYTLRVRAPIPNILRHDMKLGKRFTCPVDVSFAGVNIMPKAPEASETGTAAAPGAGPVNMQNNQYPASSDTMSK